jgi:hypothetical protein
MFKSGGDFFIFSDTVRGEHRYVFTEFVDKFLRDLAGTARHRHEVITRDTELWRAQLNCGTEERRTEVESDLTAVWDEDVPFGTARMKPKRHAAHEGRANPKGIPYLYVATNLDTAMAEVRPWIGAKISLSSFRTVRDVTIINCAVDHDAPLTRETVFAESPPELVTQSVWQLVDRAFAKPVTDDDATAEYVPTQIIAELFKREGLDGLRYKSRVGDGYNIALFHLDSAEVIERHLFSVKSVAYAFTEETSWKTGLAAGRRLTPN